MSHQRIAFVLTCALSVVAPTSASRDDPPHVVWPVAASWPRTFGVASTVSLVMGDSRVLILEPAQISSFAWSDGALQWKSDLAATLRPAVDGGRVFVPAGDAIHALSESAGTEIWRKPVGRLSIAPTAGSGWLIVSSEDGSLQGINAAQGQEVWRIALPAALTTTVVIDGDLAVGACEDGEIRAWQIADGAVRWTHAIGTRPTQLLAASGHVFVGGADGQLFSLRPRDGRRNWAYKLEMTIVGPLAADEMHVYAATIDNAVNAHTFNGHRKWRGLLAGRVVDGVYADAGQVFVPQSNGEIRIFLAKGGNRAGRLSPSRPESTVIGGLVGAGTGDQLRLALTVSGGPEQVVTTYRRTGLAAVPATSPPAGTALLLSLPGGGS